MGQRTCMIVRQRNYNKYNNTWSDYIYVFHEQWGIGKCLPSDCLALFLDANRKAGTDLIGYRAELNTAVAYGKAWNCTGDYGADFATTQEMLKSYDFRDIKQIKDFIDHHHDNNNGGVYIEITCPNYDCQRINYAFFSGCEEEKKGKYCDKGLTYKQWMNNWKEYKNKDFDKMWAMVCKWSNATPFNVVGDKLVPDTAFEEEGTL